MYLRPVLHDLAAAVEQVGASVCRLGGVAHDMGQSGFYDHHGCLIHPKTLGISPERFAPPVRRPSF